MNDAQLRNKFHKAISELEKKFVANPLSFFSEADVSWRLCSLLERDLANQALHRTSVNGKRTALVHQEYGTPTKGGRRFDVVLLRPADVQRIDDNRLRVENKYVTPLDVAEISCEYGAGRVTDLGSKMMKDVERLRMNGIRHGHVMGLFKTPLRRPDAWLKKAKPGLKENLPDIRGNYEVLCLIINMKTGYVGKWDGEDFGEMKG
jgi:hypothetical protein